ncbi:phage terminase small subunit P27 family [Pseudomonadota bacterium]
MTENIPTPPAWLTDEAKEHWNRVAPQAIRNRTLDENHVYAFGLMCESIADLTYLQGVIREEGLCIPGADNNKKAHPALRQLESCRAHVLKMLESFGLTARSKKNVKETRPDRRDNPFYNLDDDDEEPRKKSFIDLARKA